MGAKTWMLVLCDSDPKDILTAAPVLDRTATVAMAVRLFPGEALTPLEDGSLNSTNPPDDELVIGSFAGLTVVAAAEFGIDYPSRLPASFLAAAPTKRVYLHAMHSVVDWFAYAVWQDGQLVRALSLSPDSGILENIGTPFPFEEPYWDDSHPVNDPDDPEDDYPLAFHPLELAEDALFALFGYHLEGEISADLDPEDVPLMRFRRSATT